MSEREGSGGRDSGNPARIPVAAELPAGMELDVAVHLAMGWKIAEWDVADARGETKGLRMEHGRPPTREECERYAALPYGVERGLRAVAVVPYYSTDIAAAWQVVEKMRERGVYLTVIATGDGFNVTDTYERDVEQANRAPLAICRAALKAVAERSEAQ